MLFCIFCIQTDDHRDKIAASVIFAAVIDQVSTVTTPAHRAVTFEYFLTPSTIFISTIYAITIKNKE